MRDADPVGWLEEMLWRLVVSVGNQFRKNLRIGDRVRLSGYEMDPEWLGGREAHYGDVVAFIPGQNGRPAAVVRVDDTITVQDTKGDLLVLELRFEGAQWKTREVVHVELCDFTPEPVRSRHRGRWVESHAIYRVVD